MRFLMLILLTLGLVQPLFAQETHQGLSSILSRHITDGKVDYNAVRSQSRRELQAFVDSLAQARPDELKRTEQIAFWLDAYNGLVIYQVVETGTSPEKQRDRAKFFRGRRFQVAGRAMTLDDIEHRALRPLAQDPRVHFVLVCGAQSCPPLSASSFLGTADLGATLDEAARTYISDPKNVEIDPSRRRVVLNRIFDWYKADFGDDVLRFVAGYLEPAQAEELSKGVWTIEYRDYDWSLNQVKDL